MFKSFQIALVLTVTCVLVAADDKEAAAIKSSRAKRALVRYESVMTKAKRDYERTVSPVHEQTLRELDAAIQEAKKNGDMEDAEKIEQAKKSLVKSAPTTPLTAAQFQQKLTGTRWSWAGNNNMEFTDTSFRLSYWKPDEFGTYEVLSEHTALLTPPKGRAAKNGNWEFTVNPGFTHFMIVTDDPSTRTGQLLKGETGS